jgi:homoserine acetyltransferase
MGTPRRDETGLVTNAVLLLHGAAQSAADFLGDEFMKQLFGPDQPLDSLRYFLILPDRVDNADPLAPGEGTRARTPSPSLEDIVGWQYRLVLEHLGVNHLRLIVGNTTGGTQAWAWGQIHPYFVDALVVIDCPSPQTVPIADRATARASSLDAEGKTQAPANDPAHSGLGAVRATVVAILSEDGLDAEHLITLRREIAQVRNGRYFMVPSERAPGRNGAFERPQSWRVILPELLESGEGH